MNPQGLENSHINRRKNKKLHTTIIIISCKKYPFTYFDFN
jgi:hypothetical protein